MGQVLTQSTYNMFRFLAPEFGASDPGMINQCLFQAEAYRPKYLPQQRQDEAVALYAAWLATIRSAGSGNGQGVDPDPSRITEEREGDLSRRYADPSSMGLAAADTGDYKARFDRICCASGIGHVLTRFGNPNIYGMGVGTPQPYPNPYPITYGQDGRAYIDITKLSRSDPGVAYRLYTNAGVLSYSQAAGTAPAMPDANHPIYYGADGFIYIDPTVATLGQDPQLTHVIFGNNGPILMSLGTDPSIFPPTQYPLTASQLPAKPLNYVGNLAVLDYSSLAQDNPIIPGMLYLNDKVINVNGAALT